MRQLHELAQEFNFKGVTAAFRDVELGLLRWQLKTASYFEFIQDKIREMKMELDITKPDSQKARIEIQIRGYQNNLEEVRQVVKPLLDRNPLPSAAQNLFLSSQQTQHLLSYEPIVFRDWSWGQDENATAAGLLQSIWPRDLRGDVAVWGVGAGRLSFDLIQKKLMARPLLCDLNPYLIFLAERMYGGDSLHLFEFPINPMHTKNSAVERVLRAPTGLSVGDYKFLMCDVTENIFAKDSFKGILTPWLIDIVSDPFHEFIKKINFTLTKGGYWVNFGPLGFNRKKESENLTIEEIQAIAKANGFAEIRCGVQEVDYLRRQESGQCRREKVMLSVFKKVSDSETPSYEGDTPGWLLDPTQPIHLNDNLKNKIAQLYSESLIFSRVDGKSSIREMAGVLSIQLKLSPAQCEALIKSRLMSVLN